MKKLLLATLLFVFAVMLVSCGSKATFKFELVVGSEMRDRAIFTYNLEDENGQLNNSKINYYLYQKGNSAYLEKTEISKTGSSFTVSNLVEGNEYYLHVTTSLDGKEYVIYDKVEFKTNSTGSSEDNPYSITNYEQFYTYLTNDNSGYFRLDADIDLSGHSYTPFFTSASNYFAGTFDGNGHSIKNFILGSATSNQTVSYANSGLFGGVNAKGTVKNLTIEGAILNVYRSSSTYYGILAGYNAGTIENVTIKNSSLTVAGSTNAQYVGGLVGQNQGTGTITNCHLENVHLNVTSKADLTVGGIVAFNAEKGTGAKYNTISNNEFKGTITVNDTRTDTATRDYSVFVGGIIGKNNSVVKNNDFDGELTVKVAFSKMSSYKLDAYIGGLVGLNHKESEASVYGGKVSVKMDVDCKTKMNLALGLVAGQNGMKESNYTPTINNVEAKATETVTVSALDGLNVGLIGKDFAKNTKVTLTEELEFAVTIFENSTDETGKELRTITISTELERAEDTTPIEAPAEEEE